MLRRIKPLPRPELSERRKGGYSREIDRPEKAERHEKRQIYRSNTEAESVAHERFQFYFPHRHESQTVGDEEKGFKSPRTGSGELDAGNHAPSSIPRQTNLKIIATKWVADLDDREIVTLIVKDDVKELEENRAAPGETRWSHIYAEGNMTLEQLDKQMTMIHRRNGLDHDDIELVKKLLDKVKSKAERKFVHGKYLKPITFIYEGEYPEEDLQATRKSTMFVCMPMFTLGDPRKYNTTKEKIGYPVKALLQSLYRLESTVHREGKQVAAKMGHSDQLKLIHVPQLWALVINEHTIITYGPLDMPQLYGSTIKIMKKSKAQSDGKSWFIHFTDDEHKVYYLELRLCKSWFGLVTQVADDCLQDENVRDELLSAKPQLNLVAHDDSIITVESWPKMLKARTNEIIRLKLVHNYENIRERNPSLVTYVGENRDMKEGLDVDSVLLSSSNSDEDSNISPTSLVENDRLGSSTIKLRRMKDKLDHTEISSTTRSRAQEKIADMEEQVLALITEELGLKDSKLAKAPEVDKILYSNASSKPAQGTNEELQDSFSLHPEATDRSERTISSHHSSESEVPDTQDRARLSPLRLSSSTDKQQASFPAVGSSSTNPKLHESYLSQEKIARRVRFSHFLDNDSQDDENIVPFDTNLDVVKLDQEDPKSSTNDIAAKSDTIRHSFDATSSREAEGKTYQTKRQQQEAQKGRKIRRNGREPLEELHMSMTETEKFPPNARDVPFFSWSTGCNSSGSDEPIAQGTRFVTLQPTQQVLEKTLDRIHTQLQDRATSTTSQVKMAELYSTAPTKTIEEVEKILSNSQNNDKNSSSQKRETFDLARKIITAWVPYDCETPVIKKYWGAVYRLLDDRRRDHKAQEEHEKQGKATTFLKDTRVLLLGLWDLVEYIQYGVRTEDRTEHPMLRIPPALRLAFKDLILFFILISRPVDAETEFWSDIRRNLYERCIRRLSEGPKQIFLMMHTQGRAGFEALDSETLLMLVIENVLAASSTEDEFHLTELYSKYTSNIQSLVRERASVRIYDDIKLLREEIDAINFTLNQQKDILKGFLHNMDSSSNPSSLNLLVVERMLEAVRQQIDDIDELRIQAETTRYLAAQSISLKAESNNRAILVFTVVTIIFLPLSFVTSFLGMNTSDLRAMNSNQTIFWAIALPITVLVLSSALIAAYYDRLSHMIFST